MPRLTRYFIKAGMIYFVLGLLVGVLLVAGSVIQVPPQVAVLFPVYLHVLVVGWVTQLIVGVAYWMFPKYSKERPRGDERLGWVVFILLNIGLVLRIIGEPLVSTQPGSSMGWMLLISALCQLLAGWGFVFNTWTRVKER
jgi:heme/copper-type cytochrome/quinol oxidase subunit 1